ncbi:hypothetical protein B296_00038723, partial [Ensete ventricosum]
MCMMFRWIRDQQKSEEVLVPGDDVFIILRLDGRVRKSGKNSTTTLLYFSYSGHAGLARDCEGVAANGRSAEQTRKMSRYLVNP